MLQFNNYKDIKEYFKVFYWINEKGVPQQVETLNIIKGRNNNYGIVKLNDAITLFKVDKNIEFEELNKSIQDSLTYWHKRDLKELQNDYVYPFILVEKMKDECLKVYNQVLTILFKQG